MDWLQEVITNPYVFSAIVYCGGGLIYFIGKWLYANAPEQVVNKFWTYVEGPVDALIDKLEAAYKAGNMSDSIVRALVAQALVAARDRYRRFEGEDAPQAFTDAVQAELDDVVARIRGED